MKRWTDEDIEFLKENYNCMLPSEIAEILGKTQSAIRHYASRAGIKLTEKEFIKRMKYGTDKMREQFNGMFGKDNPNWKGGISKDNYHYKKLQKERYPEKVKARQIVHNAIQSGKLVRKPCEVCGDDNTQAHHEDYNKPLDVIWLCPKHHRKKHD